MLLRKDKPYAQVAPVAEQHLAAAARALDALVQDGLDQMRHPQDRRSLAAIARDLWRMLHEYDPENVTYKEKSRPPVSAARPRPSGHHHH